MTISCLDPVPITTLTKVTLLFLRNKNDTNSLVQLSTGSKKSLEPDQPRTMLGQVPTMQNFQHLLWSPPNLLSKWDLRVELIAGKKVNLLRLLKIVSLCQDQALTRSLALLRKLRLKHGVKMEFSAQQNVVLFKKWTWRPLVQGSTFKTKILLRILERIVKTKLDVQVLCLSLSSPVVFQGTSKLIQRRVKRLLK